MPLPTTVAATTIKERPILFSGPMIRALLSGAKTQTRRVLKNPPAYPGTTKFAFELHPFAPSAMVGTPAEGMSIGPERRVWVYEDWCGNVVGIQGDCPYGQPGDRLWVRETWQSAGADFPVAGGPVAVIAYRADGARIVLPHDPIPRDVDVWRPSIFMPRWASRITLEITEVRVERLNDISEEDAEAEGAHRKIWITSPLSAGAMNARGDRGTHRDGYKDIWQDINGAGSWVINPWVWCLSFRRITP